MQKIKSYWHEFKLWWREDRLIHSLYFVIGALMLCLLIVGFEICGSKEITWFFGTGGEKDSKKETVKFIAFGIGGVLAVMGAVAANRRAIAQIKNAEAQVENNKLTQKGHIDERFKSATENLSNERAEVRISAFNQFYYLAKDSQDDNLRRNVFDILCAHLRNMTNDKSYMEEDGAEKPTTECQILLSILFKSKDAVFDNLSANLQEVYLMGADLVGANLSDANLDHANLAGADVYNANLKHANLVHANLMNARMYETNFTGANLEGANLTKTKLADTNFTSAHLMYAEMKGASFVAADLSHANLSSTKCLGANLSNTNLSNANLRGADLQHAHLACANLSHANLVNARLPDTNLSEANLVDADFSSAQLSGERHLKENPEAPDERGSYIIPGADFRDADLSRANFSDAKFLGLDFVSPYPRDEIPSLIHAKLENVRCIEGTNFQGAKIKREQLPTNKGKYIAAWTTDEFWAEVEKNEES